MNTVEILMGLDPDNLKGERTKELEIKRLSKMAGKPFIVKVQAIPAKRYTHFIDGVARKGEVNMDKAYDANINIALSGLVEPSMKDKGLLDYYKCSTPAELIEKLFSYAEIGAIADAVTELSGFGGGDVVSEVKN